MADGSPVIPALKEYGPHTATGRGLTLFNTLASSWGVHPVPGGKIVWFELPVDVPVGVGGVSDGTFHFDLIGMRPGRTDTKPDGTSPQMTVDLLGIPVDLLQKASEEYEGLFRELRLMKEQADSAHPFGRPTLRPPLGAGLGCRQPFQRLRARDGRELAGGDRPQGGHLRLAPGALPQAVAPPASSTSAMLDEADEFSRSAQLLTLPASPTSVAVRRWFLSELVSQLHGQPRRHRGAAAAIPPT